MNRRPSVQTPAALLLLVVVSLASARAALAWLAEGHEVVANITADNLTPAAHAQVARILGVPDEAIAAASIRPDTEFRADKTTYPWHYKGLLKRYRPSDQGRESWSSMAWQSRCARR